MLDIQEKHVERDVQQGWLKGNPEEDDEVQFITGYEARTMEKCN